MMLDERYEFKLINKLSSKIKISRPCVVGIGDDCSVEELNDQFYQITTTDLLIEGIHFLKEQITPYELGQKSIEVTISDIAAMGGTPKSIFLSLGIPNKFNEQYLEDFFKGIAEVCNKYHIDLRGGDTSKSLEHFFINVLVQGSIKKENLKLRSTAKNQDIVCVSGNIGDSLIGLKVILEELETKNNNYFINKHNCPKAQIKEAHFLANFSEVHSMIDISDGIMNDIQHICTQSNLGVNIELGKIPVSSEFSELFKHNDLKRFQMSLESGEEYQILFTISPGAFNRISHAYQSFFNKEIYPIGTMTKDTNIKFSLNNKSVELDIKPFHHFGKKNEKI